MNCVFSKRNAIENERDLVCLIILEIIKYLSLNDIMEVFVQSDANRFAFEKRTYRFILLRNDVLLLKNLFCQIGRK
jgi:hypothetical protein